MIYIGADHRGFAHKEYIKKRFAEEHIEYVDKGNIAYNNQDDYVDFAKSVSDEVVKEPLHRGVLLCGTGVGVDMVANKVAGVRCSLVHTAQGAIQSRQHEDANVISLPADNLQQEEAYQIIKSFLETPFSGEERHVRRLEKMKEIEHTR